MKKIKIAEPCHENWNDFTPTQRGAFCGKCQINVIDFSVKSNEEIKDILVQNSGKHMCGRFSKTQLDNFNSDYHLWQNQTQNTFQSKFIFALVLTFGLTLFSCSNENESVVIEQITTTLSEGNNTTFIDSTAHTPHNSLESDVVPIPDIETDTCYTEFEMGDIMIDEPIEMVMGEMPAQEYEQEIMTKGKVAMEPDTFSITPYDNNQPMMLGMVAYYEEPNTVPPNLIDTIKDITIENNVVVSLTDKFEANLYPNPTKNRATLDINVLVNETYNIAIYDSQGRVIKNLFTGKLETGKESFRLNLNNEENGIYFIQILTDSQNESLKIIKSN